MMRITQHPILDKLERRPISFSFNGKEYLAYEGESIAAALLANNIRVLRVSEKNKEPRGIYCGIGHCYECRVMVNGERSVRACITTVKEQMCVLSQDGDRT